MMLAHNVHDVQVFKRHVHANRLAGVDNEWLTPEQAKAFCPPLNVSPQLRFPVLGAALQRRGGTARHDAVAWGYARAASALGVDIVQNCEVTGITRDATGAIAGVETTRGPVATRKLGVVAAGHSSVVLAMAGLRLPLESYPLQALVSEPVKPVFPCVVMSNTVHAYISQSDRGELVIGAGTDAYVSYSQRGGLHIASHTLDAVCELFPMFRRLRMLRNWGGIVDVTPDRSPIIGIAGAGAARELRLGHRRGVQGDAWVGACVRAHDCYWCAASDQCAVFVGSVFDGGADRRGGGGGGGALMRGWFCPRRRHHRGRLAPDRFHVTTNRRRRARARHDGGLSPNGNGRPGRLAYLGHRTMGRDRCAGTQRLRGAGAVGPGHRPRGCRTWRWPRVISPAYRPGCSASVSPASSALKSMCPPTPPARSGTRSPPPASPHGTEAMHVLRAEKGYIIAGQEADGTTTPDDLGPHLGSRQGQVL